MSKKADGNSSADLKGISVSHDGHSSKPVALAPLKTSLDYNLEDLEKPSALFMLREDFAADNKLAFNGKFRGKWTVKVNTLLAVGGSRENPKLEVQDDAQLNGPVGKHKVQLKFKPKKFSAQLDFGHHLISNNVTLKDGTQVNSSSFLNPYLFFESDRVFKKQLFGLGVLTHTNHCLRSNARINLKNEESKLDWDISKNVYAHHKGFFGNFFTNWKFADSFIFNERKALFGYDRDQLNLNCEINFAKGSFRDWKLQNSSVSASYDMKVNGAVAAAVEQNYAAQGDKTPQEVSFGYRNKLTRDLEVKSKLTLSGLMSLFLNYKLKDGLSVHSTLAAKMGDSQKKGFLEMPFDFGIKLKLEH